MRQKSRLFAKRIYLKSYRISPPACRDLLCCMPHRPRKMYFYSSLRTPSKLCRRKISSNTVRLWFFSYKLFCNNFLGKRFDNQPGKRPYHAKHCESNSGINQQALCFLCFVLFSAACYPEKSAVHNETHRQNSDESKKKIQYLSDRFCRRVRGRGLGKCVIRFRCLRFGTDKNILRCKRIRNSKGNDHPCARHKCKHDVFNKSIHTISRLWRRI